MKRGGGRRYYRPEDLELLRGIRDLLHADGYTIKGVQRILREKGIDAVKQAGHVKVSHAAPSEEVLESVAASHAVRKSSASVSSKMSRGAVSGTSEQTTTAMGWPTKDLGVLKSVIAELTSCRESLIEDLQSASKGGASRANRKASRSKAQAKGKD